MVKKFKLPFDNKGGVLVMPVRMFKHPNYMALAPQSKVLMMIMQLHWRNDKPVDYGVREAEEKIPCCRKTARKAFKELQEHGFITCVEESFFSSRTQSKARTWRLEWMPFNDNPPRQTWETLEPQKQLYGGKYDPSEHPTGGKNAPSSSNS